MPNYRPARLQRHRNAYARKIPYQARTSEMRVIIKKSNYRQNSFKSMTMAGQWYMQRNQINPNWNNELFLNVTRAFGRAPSISQSEIDDLFGDELNNNVDPNNNDMEMVYDAVGVLLFAIFFNCINSHLHFLCSHRWTVWHWMNSNNHRHQASGKVLDSMNARFASSVGHRLMPIGTIGKCAMAAVHAPFRTKW